MQREGIVENRFPSSLHFVSYPCMDNQAFCPTSEIGLARVQTCTKYSSINRRPPYCYGGLGPTLFMVSRSLNVNRGSGAAVLVSPVLTREIQNKVAPGDVCRAIHNAILQFQINKSTPSKLHPQDSIQPDGERRVGSSSCGGVRRKKLTILAIQQSFK